MRCKAIVEWLTTTRRTHANSGDSKELVDRGNSPSSSPTDRFHEGSRSAMRHWAFITLGELLLQNNSHIDRHSWDKYAAARHSNYLVGVFGIEDLEISCQDFSLARPFLEPCFNLSIKRFDTALRREGKDAAQRIFDSDWSLQKREVGVDAQNTGFEFKNDGIYLLRRHA